MQICYVICKLGWVVTQILPGKIGKSKDNDRESYPVSEDDDSYHGKRLPGKLLHMISFW